MDTLAALTAEDRFVTVDGLSIRYIEAGDGLPLILLHGASLGSSADVFVGNLAPLAAAGFRPIAFDQPGFGLSDNPTDFSMAPRKKSIMGFIDAMGLEKAVLIGHSQSGNMAVGSAMSLFWGPAVCCRRYREARPRRSRRSRVARARLRSRRLRKPASCSK